MRDLSTENLWRPMDYPEPLVDEPIAVLPAVG
jgi:hypothetical protein